MDNSRHPAASGHRSPRRELHDARPAPLKVGKHSHKAKKPPLPPQHRPPVIIYTAPPRVFHAEPSEFMSLVQRLTGAHSGTSDAATALRAASESMDRLELDGGAAGFDRTGVLSPVPEMLPAISPSFFSSPAVNASNEFCAPASFNSNYSKYVDDNLFTSPGDSSSSQIAPPPPSGYWDLFDQDQDL